jgi:hypothetical protein
VKRRSGVVLLLKTPGRHELAKPATKIEVVQVYPDGSFSSAHFALLHSVFVRHFFFLLIRASFSFNVFRCAARYALWTAQYTSSGSAW